MGLQTDFIIGEGLGIKSEHNVTQKFLLEWWNHPLNNLDKQIPDWCDELARAGNLFFLISANPMDGMTYVRPIPAEQVKEIVCAGTMYGRKSNTCRRTARGGMGGIRPHKRTTRIRAALRFQPPGGQRVGEPMLAPLLDVLGRYKAWLEDRARLNTFRTAFMYVVQGVRERS